MQPVRHDERIYFVFRKNSVPQWAMDEGLLLDRSSTHATSRVIVKFRKPLHQRPETPVLALRYDEELARIEAGEPKKIYLVDTWLTHAEMRLVLQSKQWKPKPDPGGP